jgi:hypothetical protein
MATGDKTTNGGFPFAVDYFFALPIVDDDGEERGTMDTHTYTGAETEEEFYERSLRVFNQFVGRGAKLRASNFTRPSGGSSNGTAAVSSSDLSCKDCGAEIQGFTMNGRTWTAQEAVASRIKNYNRPLCGMCAKKAKDSGQSNYQQGRR